MTMVSDSRMEWTNEEVLQLIEEYKNERVIWDATHNLYRVSSAKQGSWHRIARVFKCDVADLKKKMNSVLASHRRERHKVRGGAASTWFAYEALTFLPHHMDNPKFAEELGQDDSACEGNSDDEDDPANAVHHEIIIKQEPGQSVYIGQPARTRRLVQRPKVTRTIKKWSQQRHRPGPRMKPIENLKLNRSEQNRDECDIFGEYIANSLKKHDDRTRSMIKHAINNIIFEQEMKRYTTTHYEISVEEVNPLTLPESLEDVDVETKPNAGHGNISNGYN